LLGRDRNRDNDVAQCLQQASRVERNIELILDDQDAQRPELRILGIASLAWSRAALRTRHGQPKAHRV
jgi:hypothetical protein